MNTESIVNVRSSHSKCSRSPSSLVSAPLQLLPYLELIVHTLGAEDKQLDQEVLTHSESLGGGWKCCTQHT